MLIIIVKQKNSLIAINTSPSTRFKDFKDIIYIEYLNLCMLLIMLWFSNIENKIDTELSIVSIPLAVLENKYWLVFIYKNIDLCNAL